MPGQQEHPVENAARSLKGRSVDSIETALIEADQQTDGAISEAFEEVDWEQVEQEHPPDVQEHAPSRAPQPDEDQEHSPNDDDDDDDENTWT